MPSLLYHDSGTAAQCDEIERIVLAFHPDAQINRRSEGDRHWFHSIALPPHAPGHRLYLCSHQLSPACWRTVVLIDGDHGGVAQRNVRQEHLSTDLRDPLYVVVRALSYRFTLQTSPRDY